MCPMRQYIPLCADTYTKYFRFRRPGFRLTS